MAYVDPKLIKPVDVQSIGTLTLALRVDEYSRTRLLCRNADGQITEVLLDTNAVGHGAVLQDHEVERVWAIEDVRIEIDPKSVQETNAKIPLQILRQGAAVGIFYRTYVGFPKQTVIATVDGTYDSGLVHERLMFSRWRIVHGLGDDKVVLLEVDTAKSEFTLKPA